MSDFTGKLLAACEDTIRRQTEEIAALRQENLLLDRNTFQPHRGIANNDWDNGNDATLDPEDDDHTVESSLAAFHSMREEVAYRARLTAEAKLELEKTKLKVEKDKRAGEQSKAKYLVDSVKRKLRTLRGEITEKETQLAVKETELDDVTGQLKSIKLELHDAKIEYNTVTATIKHKKVELTNINNLVHTMQNAPNGTIDNSRIGYFQHTTNNHYYQGQPIATSVSPHSGTPVHISQVPVQPQLGTVQQDHHSGATLPLRQRNMRHHAPGYRNNCRFGSTCTIPACRFVHEEQRENLKHIIKTLPWFKG
ncbi:hypothetical protein EKO04_010715 [Ascochyta lentis]|uniref:C3H1-type domain-containing protein n=1 Tax=Ascochyta lentis TaxID=205686 RepID=A0A8H7IV15_9PLEO|nr:hypothetical protein EKO04_010715 [Ascochyta lentis]